MTTHGNAGRLRVSQILGKSTGAGSDLAIAQRYSFLCVIFITSSHRVDEWAIDQTLTPQQLEIQDTRAIVDLFFVCDMGLLGFFVNNIIFLNIVLWILFYTLG